MNNKHNKEAFSLVEILVALIAVSCISAALAPVITKKLKGNGISIGGGGIGGGSGGGFGSDVSTNCSAINSSGKCILCNKDATVCYTCIATCAKSEYKNDGTCSCHVCTDFHEKCIKCMAGGCTGCSSGYGLLSSGGCELCDSGKYVDTEGYCMPCPAGYFCLNGEKAVCPLGSFSAEGATECKNCSEIAQNCIECNENACTKCKIGYKLEGNNFCKPASSVKIFTTPGNYAFQVPETTTEITATLVSGGAGGGAGSTIEKTQTIVTSGNGNMTADANNLVKVQSDGVWTWTLPSFVVGRNFKFTACGGGGGGGEGIGGNGGYVENAVLKTNDTSLIVQVGGGGGGGQPIDNGGIGGSGGCPLGGGGGGSYSGTGSLSSSCNSSGNWGRGNWGNDSVEYNGYGGYDPIFGEHGKNGGEGCGTGCSGKGGNGSYFAGGGSGGDMGKGGGGGGAPTLFRHVEYAKIAKYVAGGGGGGNGTCGGASGGGGVTGGDCHQSGVGGKAGSATIFGSSYCTGGSASSRGKSGAMRIYYIEQGTTAGRGGGAGQIVPEQTISVTPGDVLTITVGAGGAGGVAGHISDDGVTNLSTSGEGANEAIISKITNSQGIILLTTATSVSTLGATGGGVDGTSGGKAGAITNGRNSKTIAMAGYSNTAGEDANSTAGGLGGKTILEEMEMHCSAGAGGASGVAGSDATGYGGCGGGGGGAGADGGAGAGGYVMIRYVE